MLFIVCSFFFKINVFEKFFQEYHPSVKQIGSRSGLTKCQAWSGSQSACKGYQYDTMNAARKTGKLQFSRDHSYFGHDMRFPTIFDQQRLRPACAYMQSDQSLCKSLEYSMTVKLLTKQHFEFLSLKGGCTGWSESTLVKMPHRWKPHVTAHFSRDFKQYSIANYSFHIVH